MTAHPATITQTLDQYPHPREPVAGSRGHQPPHSGRPFNALDAVDFSSRTHFFGGRFENLYLERQRIPER
jgi:hypothetical protein